MGNILLLFLVLFPMLLSAWVFPLRRRDRRYRNWLIQIIPAVELAAALLLLLWPGAALELPGVFGFGLRLQAGSLGSLLALVSAFLWAATGLNCPSYFAAAEGCNRFYFFWLLTLGALMGVFLAADLFTLFVFFEMMSFTSYVWVVQNETEEARQAGQTYLAVAVIGGMALLMALGRVSGADFLKMLGLGGFLPLDRALEKADAEDFVRGLNQKAAAAYESVTGHPIDMGQVSDEANAMQRVIDHFGLLSFIDAAKALMTCPHYMMAHPEEGYIGTYFYIVMNGIQDFVPFIWRSGDPPRRMTVEQLPHDMVDMPGLYNRRLQKPDRRKHLPITRRDPRPGGDTRHHLPLLTAGTVQPNEKIYPVEDIELR